MRDLIALSLIARGVRCRVRECLRKKACHRPRFRVPLLRPDPCSRVGGSEWEVEARSASIFSGCVKPKHFNGLPTARPLKRSQAR